MAELLHFPGNHVTERDRTLIRETVESTVFDVETRPGQPDVFWLVRCGEERPSYRLMRQDFGWEAVDLKAQDPLQAVRQSSSVSLLIKSLSDEGVDRVISASSPA